ncbi:MAG: acetyl-CoA acetyltransferase [Chloroflexi bacterium RBG_16_50_11]|nr:MAG: acetyl-CoA acetyltransferase [Chloroflexi bacterium RBG_16_50_11]
MAQKKKNAVIVGGGTSKFGVRQAHLMDMIQEAARACADDIPGLKPADIDGLIIATTMAGRHSSALNTAPLVVHRLGLKPTSICIRLDTLCSGSNSAIIVAKGLIESGIAEVILVTGAEKVYMPQRWETNYTQLAVNDHDWDSAMGLGVPPPFFAMIAHMHMKRYGTTKEQMAHVSVTNYTYGNGHTNGHFAGKTLTMQEALEARLIADPFGLYDCCPLSDGASAVIIASEERAKAMSKRPLVYLRGTGQHATHSMSAGWPGDTLAEWPHLKKAGEVALKNAKLTPKDIDVAQTHDCFTISEIIELEELGFCKKGEGGAFVASGAIGPNGSIPTNTDGGLLVYGHPFGASGARQAIEICKQLQGRAIHQVNKAAFGLTHNLSGTCAQHTVVVYGKEPVK